MTLTTNLQFGDNETGLYNKSYLVVDCKSHVSRSCSAFAPQSTPVCQELEVTVVAPTKEDMELYEWYFTNLMKNGRILYHVQDISSKGEETLERSVYFQDAFCYKIHERYTIDDNQQRLLTLSISAKQFRIEDIPFNRQNQNQ